MRHTVITGGKKPSPFHRIRSVITFSNLRHTAAATESPTLASGLAVLRASILTEQPLTRDQYEAIKEIEAKLGF